MKQDQTLEKWYHSPKRSLINESLRLSSNSGNLDPKDEKVNIGLVVDGNTMSMIIAHNGLKA